MIPRLRYVERSMEAALLQLIMSLTSFDGSFIRAPNYRGFSKHLKYPPQYLTKPIHLYDKVREL